MPTPVLMIDTITKLDLQVRMSVPCDDTVASLVPSNSQASSPESYWVRVKPVIGRYMTSSHICKW